MKQIFGVNLGHTIQDTFHDLRGFLFTKDWLSEFQHTAVLTQFKTANATLILTRLLAVRLETIKLLY